MSDLLVHAEQLEVTYRDATNRATVHALRGIDLQIHAGEIVGLIGESGCGKSTLGKAILGQVRASLGSLSWRGRDLRTISAADLRLLRRDVQMISQDPVGSLNPRRTVFDAVAEPLALHAPGISRTKLRDQVMESLADVGLSAGFALRYPSSLSGGQAQRVAIARALISQPSLIVCDEPVSSLDVSIQAQILELLLKVQKTRNLAMLFISHDLAVVRSMATKVMVLFSGRLVEQGSAEAVCLRSRHPYTRLLVSSVLSPETSGAAVTRSKPVDPPSPFNPPPGCAFHARCQHAVDRCLAPVPVSSDGGGHFVWCHRAGEPELA